MAVITSLFQLHEKSTVFPFIETSEALGKFEKFKVTVTRFDPDAVTLVDVVI